MHFINVILLAGLLAVNTAASKVNTTTTIKVLDSVTSEELAGVKVEYNNSVYYTDFDGNITISNNSVSEYEVSCISYETAIVSIKDIQDDIIKLNRLK